MPRAYDMSNRALAREETRRRIVEATAKLHGERGIFGTSWKDIAAEADVAVATVYKHFPSLDDLLPACGALVMERVQPPGPATAKEVVGEGGSVGERLERVALELYGFYERGGAHIEVDVRERALPGMREWEQHLLDTTETFVSTALAGRRARKATIQTVCSLFDLPTFKAFRTRGVPARTAATTVARLATEMVESDDEKEKR